MEWELTDAEIIEASQVDMFLPNGELDPDCGYLKGRQQVAKAAQRKLVEWIDKKGFPWELHWNDWQALKKGVEL